MRSLLQCARGYGRTPRSEGAAQKAVTFKVGSRDNGKQRDYHMDIAAEFLAAILNFFEANSSGGSGRRAGARR